jgi:putative membrane protein
MKTQSLAAFAAIAITLSLAACGAPSTPHFVQTAAVSDMYEVEAGKIASEKGQSAAVKQFGQHMVEAHTKTTEELKAIVATEKIDVKLPTALDAKHQKLIDTLKDAKTADFDKTYIEQQEEAHDDAEDLFEDYSKGGDNAALKSFAAKVLPVIKQHEQEAEKIEESL